MSITLQGNARDAGANAIVALIDAGTPPGNIQIGTSAFASILAVITLANPAFTPASGGTGVAALAGTPRTDSSADASGTAAVWRARDSAGTTVIDGTCVTTGAGADVNLSTAARNAAVNAITALLNGGTTDATGDIQFATDSTFGTVLATINLSATAFGSASAGSAAITGTPNGTASVAGTCTAFRMRNRDNVEVFRGTVGLGSGDISFDNNVWGVGTPITVSTFNFSMAATAASSVGEMVLTSLNIATGQQVSITSGSFTQPAS